MKPENVQHLNGNAALLRKHIVQHYVGHMEGLGRRVLGWILFHKPAQGPQGINHALTLTSLCTVSTRKLMHVKNVLIVTDVCVRRMSIYARFRRMERRAFIALLAAAPIAALAPWPYFLPAPLAHRWTKFVTLPTTHEIVKLAVVGGLLCALTADQTCWVVNERGGVVTSFQRPN